MNFLSGLTPSLRRDLLVLFTAGLLFWSSMASLLPVLPLYIRDVGGSNQDVGIVMGAFAIGLLCFRPRLGQLSDRPGGRKQVLLIGMIVCALGPIGFLFAHSIPALIAVRIFHGISIAAFSTAYSALVVDLSPPEQRGEVIGYMSLVNPIGVAVGPAIGGFLQAGVGYVPLFLLATGLGLVGVVCNLQVRSPAPAILSNHEPASPSESFWQVLLSPRIRIPAVTMLLIGMAFGILSTFVPLYIKETEVPLNPGLFYTAAALSSFMVRLVAGKASDRHGRGPLITVGLACYGLSMLLLFFAQTATTFLLAGLLEGAGAGIFLPTTIALMADRATAEERGRVFSLCMAGFDLGIAIAGPSLGFIADLVSYRGLFGLAAALAGLGLALFITCSGKNLGHSIRFALAGGVDSYALKESV